jgi:hypothetical protein
MRVSLIILSLAVAGVESFTSSPLPASRTSSSTTAVFGYVPDGFTAASYKEFKAKEEAKKKAQQNLGKLGPRGFQSRSMQSFQEAMERGEATHLMPVFNAKEKIARGELKVEDIPYMQRGGAWDNSDVKGAKKKRWLGSDKEYANGGYQKEQSVSIFGYGAGLDWTGKQARTGPAQTIPGAAPKFAKNYKAPNVNSIKGAPANQPNDKPKKKFGFF